MNKNEKNQTNWKKQVLIFLVLIVATVVYTYYVRIITDDELYNYGFAKNILTGLIPYKDFNMIIPPLFHYILAIFLKVLGQKLIVYHIILSVMISGITMMAYNKIGRSAFTLHLVLLTYPYTGYNIFCVLLLFILLTKKEDKYAKIIDPLLIIMMILSKQTLALLAIPSLIYAKNKKKTFLIYIVSALLFFVYLLANNNLIEFIDYCFLGMFDFTNKNGTGFNPFLIFEILIIILLSYFYKKDKDKNILYVLMFQIMAFPIVNYYHFIISFVPSLYILYTKIKKYDLAIHFALTIFISFFIFFNVSIFLKGNSYQYMSRYPIDNFMKDRVTYNTLSTQITDLKEIFNNHLGYKTYFFGYFAYLIKLNYDLPITKFDLINNGNMGYGGAKKYIEEVDDYCKDNKCIFVICEKELLMEDGNQTNKEILQYVIDEYKKIYFSPLYGVYTN